VKPQNGCAHKIVVHKTQERNKLRRKKDIVRPRIEARRSIIVAAAQIATDCRIMCH
jgi:hypothetical protein